MTRLLPLAKALQSAPEVDEFILGERHFEGLSRRVGRRNWEHEIAGSKVRAQVLVDRRQGRGHSSFEVVEDRDLGEQIRDASARALAALGPAWRLNPPAAPARVTTNDAAWQHSSSSVVDEVAGAFIAHLPAQLRADDLRIDFVREEIGAALSTGFDNRFRSTLLRLEARLLGASGHAVPVVMEARRRSDLDWEAQLDRALRLSELYARAAPAQDLACDVLLLGECYAPRDARDYGLFGPAVAQASAQLARAGMARYQLGQSITRAPVRGEALSLHSDGARDYGLRSAAFAEDGQPVRGFALVDEGVAAGQALDHRDAALAGLTANGGVRNLVVAAGTRSLESLHQPEERPLLVVDAVSELRSQPRGRILLQIDRARLHRRGPDGSVKVEPLVGGVLSGDLFSWLEQAYFSRETADYLWCIAPRGIRFDDLRVHP